eukprot:29183-Pleurochrysis_carterae.AAC.1
MAAEKCRATVRPSSAGHCWSATPAKKSMSGSTASTWRVPHASWCISGDWHRPLPSAPRGG